MLLGQSALLPKTRNKLQSHSMRQMTELCAQCSETSLTGGVQQCSRQPFGCSLSAVTISPAQTHRSPSSSLRQAVAALTVV